MKILLIEDDLDLGNGVRIALSDQGFDVIWVRRKEDALHQLDVCVPELILLDLGLPDGDGMSLMARLRQQLKGIPVIILTARGTLQDRLCGRLSRQAFYSRRAAGASQSPGAAQLRFRE
ncbi:two component transcriptional regulator [Enterobacter asburiae]|nr:two component transcriptional regulator [Enterobacter asburiae]